MTDERKLNVAQPLLDVISAACPDSSATFVIELSAFCPSYLIQEIP
ncbi:hypothetical protein C8R26_102184 [Nitrosomonas oligotropha]|uniref:Uncharacterized protein n=1 Tax=Nitrosomonas oligotropha TaxID=42354 RepID=A0A2T5I464_9PROT|nr:hypothetical protein C8R26_102184 [Nitrosomonas oligotropha]